MTEYSRSVTLTTDPDTAFGWLSDVRNLPKYFDSMTSAEPTGEGEEVHVTAQVPAHDGKPATEQEGEAWFRTDESARRLEWGSEDPGHDYHGWLEVAPSSDGTGSEVTLGIHMQHDDVDDSIGTTLERIRTQLDG